MTDTDPITIARAVEAGAAWFDQQDVPDWVDRIDPDRLRTLDYLDCPAGQMYGDFYKAPFGEDFDAVAHGFDANTYNEYAQLDAEWRRLITARRTVAVIPDGIDFDIECGVCGERVRNVATDPREARRVADQHVCDGGAS
jgi:hypothetical protein